MKINIKCYTAKKEFLKLILNKNDSQANYETVDSVKINKSKQGNNIISKKDSLK